jgi:drug/metabolite transporter (DMT)-like permease
MSGSSTFKDAENIKSVLGIGMVLISGLSFSASVLFASMALKSGIDLNTSNAVRYVIAAVALICYQKISKRPIKIPPMERFTALALGITVFMMGIGYLGATRYIPVSLAVLIFYTGPFLVFIISRFTEKEPFTLIRLTAFSIALLGLFFAMDIQTSDTFHIRGISFAFLAAIGMALFITVSNLAIRNADSQAVNVHALSTGALLFFCFLFLSSDPVNPLTHTGMPYLAGSGISLGMAYLTFYSGLKIIGPVRASMLLNIEPIFTIALSIAILGERLSITQFLGAGMVIIGIFMINYQSK